MAERRTKGGHESRDTPASELPFPEVLLRPGLGMPAPETRDAIPPEPKELALLGGLADVIALIRRRWSEASDGDGRPFLIEALESQAALAVRNLRAAISEDAAPEDARQQGRHEAPG